MRRSSPISLLLVPGLPAAAIAFGGDAWPFELAHHFIPHLAALAVVVGAILALAGRRLAALTAAALAAAYAANPIMADFVPSGGAIFGAVAASETARDDSVEISLVSFNILANQEEPAEMLHWFGRGPADVLVLLEATRAWEKRLSALDSVYPYRIMALPHDGLAVEFDPDLAGSSGIAVLSRLPLHDARISYPAGPLKPAVTVKVTAAGQAFTLMAAHPASPVTVAGLAARDAYFARSAAGMASDTGPLVVAGDFNATPFTPPFRRFIDGLGLEPPRRPPATYPALAGPFGLAIDHILVRGVELRRLDPIPPRGSDHRGLMAKLVLGGKTRRNQEKVQWNTLVRNKNK